MRAPDIERLFVGWWNFPAAMHDRRFGQALTLHEVNEVPDPSSFDVQVPFLSSLIISTTSPATAEQPAATATAGPDSFSILDQYLNAESTADEYRQFEDVLLQPTRRFLLTCSSGRTVSGSLAALCSLRLAGVISRRPSPVFFYENYTEAMGSHVLSPSKAASPHLWLPTLCGLSLRSSILSGAEAPGVPLFLYFLSGNFLPEAHGFLPPTTDNPQQWRDQLISEQGKAGSKDISGLNFPQRVSPKIRPLPEPIRLGLVASIYLVRKIIPTLPRALSGPLVAIDNLARPWPGNSFLSKEERRGFEPYFGSERLHA